MNETVPSTTSSQVLPHSLVNLSDYHHRLGWRNKLARTAWCVVWFVLFRPSPKPWHGWRRFLLRCFGAKVGRGAHPYPSARIWAPWNLEMGDGSCLADGVDCYNVARIRLGHSALVSQRSFLCSASHDHTDPAFPLVARPIAVVNGAWVAAEAFVGPGVTVGEGAIVGARACVTKDVAAWTIVVGNPAQVIKERVVNRQ
jgi:putative colanic acid biosynthesis acetyltransferase WcaF